MKKYIYYSKDFYTKFKYYKKNPDLSIILKLLLRNKANKISKTTIEKKKVLKYI